MVTLSQKQKDNVLGALNSRSAGMPCPRCGNMTFKLMGFINATVQSEPKTVESEIEVLPSALMVCEQCGFFSQHSLDVLGVSVK